MMNVTKKAVILLLGVLTTPFAMAQMPDLPVDPDVRIGKLDNGLTYYIRHNEEPKNQAAFFIAHKVGAVQEEDNQRGLAHFLEHMAFNGSKHFPAGDVFSFIQRIGVTNFNAQTGVDQTWYHLDNTPVTNPLVVDSCMLLLSDWSCQVELTKEEIEKERDVIHGEYRMSDNAQMRILERQLPVLFPGSRYGYRLPIGIMEVIDNFSPQFLKDYYTKWYHPDLQAVIVVGDIDVDKIEAKIKELFAPLKNPENEAAYEFYPVPDNEQAIYAIDKDPEQKQVTININFKHAIFPFEQRGNAAYMVQNHILNGISYMLNQRLRELAMKADCPFAAASCDDGNYIIAKTCSAFSLDIVPKDGQDIQAVTTVMAEVARAQQHGFTASEIQRYNDEVLSSLETAYNNRNKQPNSYYTRQYLEHFLENEPIPSIETEYELMKSIVPQLPAEAYNETVKGLTASTEKNFTVLAMYPEKEGVTIPTADQMKEAINSGIGAQMEAYVDEVNDEPLIASLPKPVKIKKESAADLGFTKWTLKNGANVYFKKTDFSDDKITMKAISRGGLNKLKEEDVAATNLFFNPRRGAFSLFSIVMGSTGLGNMTALEYQKKMAGKNVSIEPDLDDNQDILEGSAAQKDLRTLFELTYLSFGEPSKDVDSYNSIMSQLTMTLPQLDALHDVIQQDSVYNTIYGHNARKQFMHAATLGKADYERIRQIYRERFASAGDFDFYFAGPINEDSLRAYVEQYIATLPAQKKREDYAAEVAPIVKGEVNNTYTCLMPNEESKESRINVQWFCEAPYTVKEQVTASALGSILSDRYFNKIREEGSMGYNAGAYGLYERSLNGKYTISAYAAVKPDCKDAALEIIYREMQDIATNGVTEAELTKYREPAVTSYNASLRSDKFWINNLDNKNSWGHDSFTGREDAIKNITSDDIKAFVANKLLPANNRTTVVMIPE
jgi:zinc protease